MNKHFLAAALVAVAISASFVMPASADTILYSASLSGPNESPANVSPGVGTALITIDTTALTMEVNVTFSGLTAAATASHIHCCTTTPGVSTAGVATQTPTFTGFPAATSGTYDHVFDMTQASSFNSAYITANGGTTATAFAALVAGIDAGKAYLNIHTSAFPGGEIRGFLTAAAPVPLPAALWFLVSGLASLPFFRRKSQN